MTKMSIYNIVSHSAKNNVVLYSDLLWNVFVNGLQDIHDLLHMYCCSSSFLPGALVFAPACLHLLPLNGVCHSADSTTHCRCVIENINIITAQPNSVVQLYGTSNVANF